MKGISGSVFVIAALAVVAAVMLGTGGFLGATLPFNVFEGCTWAPDYCFASCVEYGSTTQITNTPWFCPTSADVERCEMAETLPYGKLYTSCSSGLFGNPVCTGYVGDASAGVTFSRGTWILQQGAPVTAVKPANIRIIRKTLMECGTAGCPSGGVPIGSAQGCSWSPGLAGYVWEDGTTYAKSVPFGSGYKYVCSQHLVSCPSTCTDPLKCAVPSNLRSLQVNYNGQLHNAYISGRGATGEMLMQVIGCKETTSATACIRYDEGTNLCMEYGPITYSECGTIATLNAGECAQNSDCGITGVYECDWDEINNRGECVELGQSDDLCTYDYDCSQTGSGCFNKVFTTVKCINGDCIPKNTPVGCCSIADCPTGYYCNTDRECELAQEEAPDCAFSCCDTRYNTYDANFKQKPCPADAPVCCADHTCKATVDECGITNLPSGDGGDCPPLFGFIPDIFCLLAKWWATYALAIGFIGALGLVIVVLVIVIMFLGRK